MLYLIGMMVGAILAMEAFTKITGTLGHTNLSPSKEEKIGIHVAGALLSWGTVIIFVVLLVVDKLKKQ